jgi:hypothetical protein
LVSFTNWNAREIDEILLRANSFLQFLPLPWILPSRKFFNAAWCGDGVLTLVVGALPLPGAFLHFRLPILHLYFVFFRFLDFKIQKKNRACTFQGNYLAKLFLKYEPIKLKVCQELSNNTIFFENLPQQRWLCWRKARQL